MKAPGAEPQLFLYGFYRSNKLLDLAVTGMHNVKRIPGGSFLAHPGESFQDFN
jgi:hypothetical protein